MPDDSSPSTPGGVDAPARAPEPEELPRGEAIARVMRSARRRQGAIVLGAALSSAVAGASLALLAGALTLVPGKSTATRPFAITTAVLAAALACAWGIRALLRSVWNRAGMARLLGQASPGLASELLTSLELQDDYQDIERTGRFSMALVDEQLTRAARKARAVDLARVISSRPVQVGAWFLGGVLLAHAVSFAVAARPLALAYARLAHGELKNAAPARLDPITGDVEITYLYPAYTGRAPQTLSGTGGEVNALKGTEVRLKTRADRSVAAAEIVVVASDPAAPKRFALTVADKRDLAGGFSVEDAGSYRFRFLDGHGKEIALGLPIPIAVEPDAFPQVRISSPGSEVEVDAKARVRVEWSASDDYGLKDLALVVKPPAGEERRKLLRDLTGTRRENGAFDLDVAGMGLAEGERILYFLEVHDNDAISGPKRGASATQTVKIYSEAEHQRAILEKAQVLW